MERVGSSFTEFFEKVNNASQGLECVRSEVDDILDSNTYLIESLLKLESILRNGEGTQAMADDLNSQVKPHVDKLIKALEKVRNKVPDSLFLDLPSQRHGLSIGNLAGENISRFSNLLNEVRIIGHAI